MSSIFLKFTDPDTRTDKTKRSWWKRFTETALTSFIPVGNPNFEKDIEKVKFWLLEFKDGNQYPNREIGLDILQEPIMIMPWRKNYGYWIDNNLVLNDFKSIFNSTEITEEEFEKFWNQFERLYEMLRLLRFDKNST